MQRIKKILLIDDNEGTNFYHSYILKEHKIAADILTSDNVDDATSKLRQLIELKEDITPSLIFLDVNLPKYSGFVLIHKNQELVKQLVDKGVQIYMLSSSQNPADIELVHRNELIAGFYEKPLTIEMIKQIVAKTLP